jgi:hypothetical protein
MNTHDLNSDAAYFFVTRPILAHALVMRQQSIPPRTIEAENASA